MTNKVFYELKRIVANESEVAVELTEADVDTIYLALEDYYSNLQYNELEVNELEQLEGEVSTLLYKLGAV